MPGDMLGPRTLCAAHRLGVAGSLEGSDGEHEQHKAEKALLVWLRQSKGDIELQKPITIFGRFWASGSGRCENHDKRNGRYQDQQSDISGDKWGNLCKGSDTRPRSAGRTVTPPLRNMRQSIPTKGEGHCRDQCHGQPRSD